MVIEMAISSMPFLIFGLICIIISGSSLYFTVGKLIEIKKVCGREYCFGLHVPLHLT